MSEIPLTFGGCLIFNFNDFNKSDSLKLSTECKGNANHLILNWRADK